MAGLSPLLWLLQLLLVLLVLLVPIGHVDCAQVTGIEGLKGVVTPTDPLVGTGDTLIVNCTLETTGPLDINASSMFFKFGNTRLDAKYVHMLDKHTVQLRMPNMSRSQNSGHIFCYAGGPVEDTILDHVAIQVAEYPVKPNITECRVYNWQKMVCQWEPASQDTGIATNQTLYWTLVHGVFPCPNLSANTCTWRHRAGRSSFQPGKLYSLAVRAANVLGTSDCAKLVETSAIVQPNPVRNLSVSSVGKRHLELTWLSPARNKRILYKILYKSPWMSDPQVVNTTKTNVTLQDLTPYADYHIFVSCIPLINNEAMGFWSNRSSLKQRTLGDVPGAAPVVTPGGFVTADKGANSRSVVLHWTPVPVALRHGVVLSTRIRYTTLTTPAGHRVTRAEPSSTDESVVIVTGAATCQANLMLRKDRAYQIIVDVKTIVGYNNTLSLEPVVIETESAMPARPSMFTIQGNNTGIYINWTAVDGATNYTIYWCKGSLHDLQCKVKGTLKWQTVDMVSTSLAIPLNKGRYSEYIFAISVEKAVQGGPGRPPVITSTGMLWSDCTYTIGKEVKAPKQVRFTAHQESESLRVAWTRPPCRETGYIRSFLVIYCLKEHCEERRVDPMKKEYQISGLHADEIYKVKVISQSPLGMNASSAFIEQKVHRSGLTRGAIAGVIVAAALVALFIFIGIIATVRKCKKSVEHYKTLGIAPPERPITTLPPRMVEEDDDNMPDPLVDGSVPYFVPNHSGQSRVRENFENDELERAHCYHENMYPGRRHSSQCQSVNSGPDASIYSVDTVMSTLESSAGSRLDDVFVDPARGSAKFYSVAPSNSLDIVPEEMSLLNHQPAGGAVAGAVQAPHSGESEGDEKMAEVNNRLLEQNGDIDDSMLESAAVHNLQMLLQANNNNASGMPRRATKGGKPLLSSVPSSSPRQRESRENSVQSDDCVVSSISPYCQVGDVPNGNAAGTALSSGGYVHHGSVLIAGGVDNRNNANNNNNVHLGGTSIHSSEGDNLNAPFFIAEESDGSATTGRVPPNGPSVNTPIPVYNNGADVSRTGDSISKDDVLDDTGTKHCHFDSQPTLNSAGYVTEVLSPGTPPSSSPLRPMPVDGGYVMLDDVTVQSDTESGSDVASSSSGLGDTASSPRRVSPLPSRDSYSSVDSNNGDIDPVNFTSPMVAQPGATTRCKDNPGGASSMPDCFRGNHIPRDSLESNSAVPPSEHERLLANDGHNNGALLPLHSPEQGPNDSCGKAYQDPGYTQVVNPDRWSRTPHNVPSGYVTLPPILQNGITGTTTS